MCNDHKENPLYALDGNICLKITSAKNRGFKDSFFCECCCLRVIVFNFFVRTQVLRKTYWADLVTIFTKSCSNRAKISAQVTKEPFKIQPSFWPEISHLFYTFRGYVWKTDLWALSGDLISK